MENLLILIIGFVGVWVMLRRFSGKFEKSLPRYICLFEKDIQKPENLNTEKYKIAFLFGITLKKRVVLPFPPQHGMSVSELEDIPVRPVTAKEDAIEDINFDSGEIEHVRWDNSRKTFTCKVAPYQITNEDELGLVLTKGIARGWKINGDGAKRAIEDFLDKWKDEIEQKEKETGSLLAVDREELEKIKVVLNGM